MVKERARTQGIPPRGHGGCEHVVSLGSQVVGSTLCGNKYCPSGSHRSLDHFFLLSTAGPIRSDSRPLQDTLPPTLASWASLPSGGDTLTGRSSPTRGDSGRGESTPATAGSTLGPRGHTSISDTAPTTLCRQRATGSHSVSPTPPTPGFSPEPPAPSVSPTPPTPGLSPLRPRRRRSPRQQHPRVFKTAHHHTRPPTKPGDRTPNPGAALHCYVRQSRGYHSRLHRGLAPPRGSLTRTAPQMDNLRSPWIGAPPLNMGARASMQIPPRPPTERLAVWSPMTGGRSPRNISPS